MKRETTKMKIGKTDESKTCKLLIPLESSGRREEFA